MSNYAKRYSKQFKEEAVRLLMTGESYQAMESKKGWARSGRASDQIRPPQFAPPRPRKLAQA